MKKRKPIHTIRIAGSEVMPLEASDTIQLTCGIAGCPSNCCTNGPHIILNPYEIALICRASGMSYEDLLDIVETDRVNGFPLVMLPRDPACHFWTGEGCRIYAARPLACRLFPIGRVFENGQSFFVLPDRNLCAGLVPGTTRTLGEYLKEQDTETQVRMADAWIEFVTAMEQLHLPDKPVTSVAFHLLVYSPDTPPASGPAEGPSNPEDRFLLRLSTARQKLPHFLKIR
jgi:uncharacterized protein